MTSITEPREIKLSPIDKRKFFGAHRFIDRFRMSDVSIYSTTPLYQAEIITSLLLSYYTPKEMKEKTITDATGCIGGNSYSFMKSFKLVNFVELYPLHADIFQHNANLYEQYNCQTIIGNYLDVCLELKQDIIFIDPPWGGTNYGERKNAELFLGDVSISKLIDDLIDYAEIIMLKLPKTYDEIRLLNNTRFSFETIILRRTDGAQLYKIIIISRPNMIRRMRRFIKRIHPLGYRAIKWELI